MSHVIGQVWEVILATIMEGWREELRMRRLRNFNLKLRMSGGERVGGSLRVLGQEMAMDWLVVSVFE
jgi:hypothetical protein